MVIVKQQQKEFSDKEKKAFFTKHGLDPENPVAEFRRNQADFFMQEDDKGGKRLSASASKGIPFRYYDSEQREIMYVDNYVPATGIDHAKFQKPDLKFRYAQSIIVTEFDKLFFLLEHPNLKGSDLNKLRHPKGEFIFYIFDPEKEAQEKVDRQRMEARAIMAVEEITDVEQLRVTARGFQIQDTENKKQIVLREELMSLAKSNPKTFLDKLKTEEFKITSLVYEAKEKGKIIYQPVERSWYIQSETMEGKKETRDKIYTVTAGEKPEESLITWLQSVKSGDWRKQLTQMLETESV